MRYATDGLAALADKGSKPDRCPHQMAPEIKARIVEMRRSHPGWRPRTILNKLRRELERPPSRAAIYRCLVRHRLVQPKPRRRRRDDYKRWERSRSMELWQIDVMGNARLASGLQLSVVTGVDDHSRFCVIAKVVARATARPVCDALLEALHTYGIPEQILTDNDKVFTGRLGRKPANVLFDRICLNNGIRHLLTAPYSPTTTGKVERFHRTLRKDFFSDRSFDTIEEMQAALDVWVAKSRYAGDSAISWRGRSRWRDSVQPRLVRESGALIRVGHPLLDAYLELVAARARPNTVLAQAYDLKVFFSVVHKDPAEVTHADVLDFIKAQRQPRLGDKVVRIEDGEAGLSARTIKRRLATIAGLYDYLIVRGDAAVERNPVPRGLAVRRPGQKAIRGVPLIRAPRTLPRIVDPVEIDALMDALRTQRDRAMVQAMLLGGLRRCEVLGLALPDIRPGEQRLFIAEGKGGHERIVPVSTRFFTTLASYLEVERPAVASIDRVFVVLKGPRRGQPLSAAGLDEIIAGARRRAGIDKLTCHQLRHTCFTRLREAGMALEAIQAQAGHRSIESTRIYLHLANDWLADEYRRASEAIDAQAMGEW